MKETLEEAKFRIYKDHWNVEHTQWIKSNFLNGFEAGAKWQQEQYNSANGILEYILLNDDGVGIALGYNSREMIEQYFKRINYKLHGKSK